MTLIVDGKKLAEEILENLKEQRKAYDKIVVAAFLIGKDKEKESFLKIKKNFAEKLNIDFRIYEIENYETFSRKKLRKYISQIVKKKVINGALIQLPLPSKFKTQYFLNAIPSKKDIDCLSSKMLGKFFTDSEVISPPAVETVKFLKEKYNLKFESKIALVVGYGKLIGKPLSHYLAREGATVIISQSKTNNLEKFLKEADIVISGVGKANLIQTCKEGAILIDFGYSFENNKICGDLDFEKLKNKAALITPTPGGTGPILVAKLFENLFKLLQYKLPL
ncbi:Bifunctional protein FolD protein [bacterium HR35]|nr:Bifunctional protein FolD protein [bacterium HR35]